jgi:hypothetical protein
MIRDAIPSLPHLCSDIYSPLNTGLTVSISSIIAQRREVFQEQNTFDVSTVVIVIIGLVVGVMSHGTARAKQHLKPFTHTTAPCFMSRLLACSVKRQYLYKAARLANPSLNNTTNKAQEKTVERFVLVQSLANSRTVIKETKMK